MIHEGYQEARREAQYSHPSSVSFADLYEATQNAPPLAVGMNESESESNFENDAKRLRLKAPLLAAGIFT
jgi:hypothetical protein